MNELGKTLFFAGLAITLLGLALWLGVGRGWLGRMPGDVHYTRGSFSVHFPLVTCLLISVVLSLLLWFFRR